MHRLTLRRKWAPGCVTVKLMLIFSAQYRVIELLSNSCIKASLNPDAIHETSSNHPLRFRILDRKLSC
jgi:hypothetical protein